MVILSWNCRGLGNQRVVDLLLSQLVREKAPKVLFLMETKQSIDEMRQIQAELLYHCMLPVPSIQRSGELAMLWMEEVDLHIQTFTLHHIDALMEMEIVMEEQRKHESWKLLRHLHSQHLVSWVYVNDFNEILTFEEKQGGLPKSLNLMQDFRASLLHCGLVDLGFQGNIFTWNNGRHGEEFV